VAVRCLLSFRTFISPTSVRRRRAGSSICSRAKARGADALYILGDFFESWIGDDDLERPFNAVIAGCSARSPGAAWRST
jgi:hypothetical protein